MTKPVRLPQESLLPRIARGDRHATRLCVERYGTLVWSLARRFSSDASDAEDAVQEIFLEIWRSAARFDETVASETTFVVMVARRKLIDRRRARGRQIQGEPLQDFGELEPSVAASAEASAEVALAARAVAELRPDQRRVLVLSARDGFSHGEIAETLGMPLGTVKANARRALIAVRAALFGAPRSPEEMS
jgi:RNA polymerase sigma-70 factor (ECF subfamily)